MPPKNLAGNTPRDHDQEVWQDDGTGQTTVKAKEKPRRSVKPKDQSRVESGRKSQSRRSVTAGTRKPPVNTAVQVTEDITWVDEAGKTIFRLDHLVDVTEDRLKDADTWNWVTGKVKALAALIPAKAYKCGLNPEDLHGADTANRSPSHIFA